MTEQLLPHRRTCHDVVVTRKDYRVINRGHQLYTVEVLGVKSPNKESTLGAQFNVFWSKERGGWMARDTDGTGTSLASQDVTTRRSEVIESCVRWIKWINE